MILRADIKFQKVKKFLKNMLTNDLLWYIIILSNEREEEPHEKT